MAVLAGSQPEVDQIGRGVVPDRVPVLARPVHAQRGIARVEVDRIDVREVATFDGIPEELVEEVDRHVDVAPDARVRRDAIDLDRARQRIDLLVGRDRVVVVAELGGQDLPLLATAHVHRVVPVGDVLALIDRAHVVAQVLRAPLRRLQVAVLAGHQEGGGEAVDHAGDGVRLLPGALDLLAFEGEVGSVLAVVDDPVRKLRVEIELGQLSYLVNPPALRFVPVLVGLPPGQDDALGLEPDAFGLGHERPVGEQVAARGEQGLDGRARVLERLAEVAHHLGIAGGGQAELELTPVGGPQPERPLLAVAGGDVTRDCV